MTENLYEKDATSELAEKIVDEKLYRVVRKKDCHINIKENSDGSKSAIQFDKDNSLAGPLDIIEVDEDALVRTKYVEVGPPMRTFGQIIVEDVVAPALEIVLEQALEEGVVYFSKVMKEKVAPKAKKKANELTASAKVILSGLKDGMTGKETKVSKIIKLKEVAVATSEKTKIEAEQIEVDNLTFDKEVLSREEIQQIINLMKRSAFTLVACINLLRNSIVADDGSDPKRKMELQKNFEELTTANVMNQIDLMLDERNKDLLDQESYRMLAAFREGNFIVNSEAAPITNYLPQI
jgi:hypothetical protein